jgi:hypothetical protein
MPELIILGVILSLVTLPQLIAGFLARSMGKSFWFWYFISFIIPIISIIILLLKNDNKPGRYRLADHVNN